MGGVGPTLRLDVDDEVVDELPKRKVPTFINVVAFGIVVGATIATGFVQLYDSMLQAIALLDDEDVDEPLLALP